MGETMSKIWDFMDKADDCKPTVFAWPTKAHLELAKDMYPWAINVLRRPIPDMKDSPNGD